MTAGAAGLSIVRRGDVAEVLFCVCSEVKDLGLISTEELAGGAVVGEELLSIRISAELSRWIFGLTGIVAAVAVAIADGSRSSSSSSNSILISSLL